MVLDKLGASLRGTLKRIANAGNIDADLIKDVVKEIQRALLQADVNVRIVLGVTKELERRALEEKPPQGMSSREHTIHIIHEELATILGEGREITLEPHRILLMGLYGQGKTTTTGKLARWFTKRGLKTGVIAADVYRPAAYDQLKTLADSVGVAFHGDRDQSDPRKIVEEGLKVFSDHDIVIIDSAGRHSLDDDLIQEIADLAKLSKADERILVLDAAVGQQAGPQAAAFHEAAGVNGVIITKMDGTAKGGGALSAVAATEAQIVFLGVGEHIDDLERFHATRFLGRLLGMGDLESLIERAKETIDEEQAEVTVRKLMSGKFNLQDMYDQMKMVTGMGPLKKIMAMLPGIGGQMDEAQLEATQERLENYRIILDSMTTEEKENPKLIRMHRIKRIARGAGVEERVVRDLLAQYNQSRKTMKGLTGNRKMRKALQQQMKGGGFPGL